jgi:hypothetical protein
MHECTTKELALISLLQNLHLTLSLLLGSTRNPYFQPTSSEFLFRRFTPSAPGAGAASLPVVDILAVDLVQNSVPVRKITEQQAGSLRFSHNTQNNKAASIKKTGHPCIHAFRQYIHSGVQRTGQQDNRALLAVAGNTYTYMPSGKRISHTSMHSAVQRRHSDYTIGIHSDLVIQSREQGIRLSNIRHSGNTNMQGRGVASKSKRVNRGGGTHLGAC